MAGLSEEIAFEEQPAWQRRREGMFQAEGRSREAGMFQKQEGGAAGAGGVGVRGQSQGRGHDWQVSMSVGFIPMVPEEWKQRTEAMLVVEPGKPVRRWGGGDSPR